MEELILARQIATSQQRNRAITESQQDFTSRPYWATGRFLMDGTGELAKDLLFPVLYIEEPTFFFGGSLEDNQSTTIGSLPTISGVVIGWDKYKKGNNWLYKGCRVAVVATGDTGQRMWFNWNFVGQALVNPTGGLTTTDGTV